jgi:hypothetical protein
MIYHTITGKATPGREEEAVRWLKKIAQYNEQNYSRTVEVLHPLDGPDNVYIFAIKVDSFAVWEADTGIPSTASGWHIWNRSTEWMPDKLQITAIR